MRRWTGCRLASVIILPFTNARRHVDDACLAVDVPKARGGRIDFRVFGRLHWRPAQIAVGIEPTRGLYDLRNTYATFALRAGVPVFVVSRFIGSSMAMIDRPYGHLARDGREHAVALLDAFATETAAWTPGGHRNRNCKPVRREPARAE